MISKFREKILKSSEAVVHELFYWLFGLDIQEKPPKNVSAPETCSVTTHGPYHAVSLMQFSENLKKATPQSHKKSWWKWKILNENIISNESICCQTLKWHSKRYCKRRGNSCLLYDSRKLNIAILFMSATVLIPNKCILYSYSSL